MPMTAGRFAWSLPFVHTNSAKEPLMASSTQLKIKLERYDRLLGIAMSNLMELDAKVLAYQAIFSDKKWITLEGVTKARVEPALKDFRDLWVHIRLLEAKVLEAKTLFQKDKRGARTNEIAAMLDGPSIELPTEAVPLRERALVTAGAGQDRIAPADLLRLLTQAFEKVRDFSCQIQDIWDKFDPRIEAMQKEAVRLRDVAQAIGVPVPAVFAQLEAKIASCEKQLKTDPYGANADLEGDIDPLMRQVTTFIEEAERHKATFGDRVTRAGEQLKQVRFLRGQVSETFAEATAKVKNPTGLIAADDETAVEDFLERLEVIKQFDHEGQWKVAARAIDLWLEQIADYETELKRRLAANRIPLALRDDLRSELGAYQSKAISLRLIEDEGLSRIARQAKDILYSRPSDLVRARQLVTAYEAMLNQLAGRRSAG
jgi:hypothetical protein